ncbi:hypothetical protein NP493_189g01015 [Ridgeia piscesae]|uniref:Uncharacterized protein n=1 Tax=Ridgeia piscesae TaxID=27915 RepID=A0AAD9P265_RIDPI|nr:hypothetical protein NP493_189g01015 [Ridgeia piscesae]
MHCRMDKLRQRLHLSHAKAACALGSSLDAMVRESMYVVWPVAEFPDEGPGGTGESSRVDGDDDDR